MSTSDPESILHKISDTEMTPTHTKWGEKKYRYYVTCTANKRSHEECPVRMLGAGEPGPPYGGGHHPSGQPHPGRLHGSLPPSLGITKEAGQILN